MRYIYLITILLVSQNYAYSKCMAKPNILSEVEIIDCNGVTFHSSPTLRTFGDSIPGKSRIDKENSKVSGTIITAKIITSTSIWKYTFEYTGNTKAFETGSIELLFVNDNPEVVCPETIDQNDRTKDRKQFVTLNWCCDTSPKEGACIVPYSLPIVKEEPNPEKWYQLRKGDTKSK